MHDLAERLGGQQNYRGGYFEPSLFAFYSYDWFKNITIASADGRSLGTGLSRGVNPSETTENINIATLLHSLKGLDYTEFPGGAVTYMDMTYGLRTLDEDDKEFHPFYEGPMEDRDMAYHQGTVWTFPLGSNCHRDHFI